MPRPSSALKTECQTEEAAVSGIFKQLRTFYASRPTVTEAQLAGAIAQIQQLHRTNVFPEMKMTWGTPPAAEQSHRRAGLFPVP
jgi:hypothetical protein